MKTIDKTATAIFMSLIQQAENNNNYIKIDNTKGVFMPLSIERLEDIEGYKHYSFAHYGKQNGDLMADPEMCFLIIQNKVENMIFPYSYRNDYMGFNTTAFLFENGNIKGCNKNILHSHITFANMWLRNIKEQQDIKLL